LSKIIGLNYSFLLMFVLRWRKVISRKKLGQGFWFCRRVGPDNYQDVVVKPNMLSKAFGFRLAKIRFQKLRIGKKIKHETLGCCARKKSAC